LNFHGHAPGVSWVEGKVRAMIFIVIGLLFIGSLVVILSLGAAARSGDRRQEHMLREWGSPLPAPEFTPPALTRP
jgi:hypothetical protein